MIGKYLVFSKAKHFVEHEVARKLRDWYYSFLPTQSTIFSPDRCCLSIDQGKIFLIHVRKVGKILELVLGRTYQYRHLKDIKTILTQVVQEHALQGVRCSWILRPEQYQLLQTEVLPVPPNEFQAAIRWKIKGLLRFPVEDAVVDSFAIPTAKLPTALNTIMLVIARISILKPMSEQIAASGLKLTTIDIPELSFRNLTALYEKNEKSTAFIYLQEKNSQLIITNQRELYFSRQLNFGMKAISSALASKETKTELDQLINEASLDIQRSFDYYQSQWRQNEPARIFLETVHTCPIDIADLLSQRLSVAMNKIDFERYFHGKSQVDLKQSGHFLPLLGGVLREWEQNYATGN